jgi:branched-chain amino acid transport system substrate-binding protein
MTQKNETPILILSLIVTLGVLGGGVWWLSRNLNWQPITSPSSPTTSGEIPPSSPSGQDISLLFSAGERLLVPTNASADKIAGIDAIAAGDYARAVPLLESALAENLNDPEARIYLNNAQIGTGPSYTLAIAAPISSSTDVALELLRGVAQAQTEINQAGGIQGVPLRILIADDQNNAAVATQVATYLVQDATVLAVIGHFSSDVTLAVGQIYQDGQLVMVSPTSTSVDISNLGDYVFRTVQSDRIAADSLARYMLTTMQVNQVAIFYNSQSSYSLSLKDAFNSAVLTGGGQVTGEFDLSLGTFNPQAAVEQAIQQGAQAIMLAANTPTRNQAIQVIAANRQRLKLLGGDSLYNAEVLQAAQDAGVGMIVAAPWNRDANPQATFPQAARQLWGGDVSWRTAMTYDAAIALAKALQANPTRMGVHQALNDPAFAAEGAASAIRFLPSGDRNQASQLVKIEPNAQSQYGYDFVPVP